MNTKKIFALVLAGTMVMSLAACGNKNKTEDSKPSENVTESTDVVENTETNTEETTPVQDTPTIADALVTQFKDLATKDDATAESIATKLAENEVVQFGPSIVQVEPGFLAGFDEEIHDFKECYTMGPMIGSIPFVSYVFTLEDGADTNAFVENLEKNANLRWNICVTADQMETAVEGNYVFFVMAPLSMDEDTPDIDLENDNMMDGDITDTEVEEPIDNSEMVEDVTDVDNATVTDEVETTVATNN